jgi:membrane protease YdiL (CAAX protease family)
LRYPGLSRQKRPKQAGYFMSDAVRAPKAPRTWYFFGTLGFGLLAYGAFTLGGFLTCVVFFIARYYPSAVPQEELFKPGYWQSAASLGAYPCELAVIWLAVRLARRRFSEYLALIWPERNELIIALLVMFIVVYALGLTGNLLHETLDAGVIAEYRDASSGGPLLLFLFLVTGCLGAPIFEELAVRGFLFRGWSESFLRPTGAILLGSGLWAACHFQYDWFGMFEVFVMGLVLGFFRYRSGSTMLAMVVHSAINLYFFFLIGLTT